MSKEPEWEAYDPQLADEWRCWASDHIEELERLCKTEFDELNDEDYQSWVDVAGKKKIEELEAERDDCARVNRDMCAENVRLKAKLDAAKSFSRSVWTGEGGGNNAFEKAWLEALQEHK